jgi:dTDP-4-dehydrorhamnose reductase
MRRKILLTGKSGQIGIELARLLPALGEVFAPDRREMDLQSPDSTRRMIRDVRPKLIVNAAAYTDVSKAEIEKDKARAINADAPGIMAEEGKKIGSVLLHYSTDYVFDGTKTCPYDEEDKPNPINVYGETKLAGEHAVQHSGVPYLIFRTAWVYGMKGQNFLTTVLHLATERKELTVVRDQIGAPTWSREIAAATKDILVQLAECGQNSLSKLNGVYHLTSAGQTNRFDFANAILEEASRTTLDLRQLPIANRSRPIIARRIIPVTTERYPSPARRPAYSVLSNKKVQRAFGVALPDWRFQLQMAFTSNHF